MLGSIPSVIAKTTMSKIREYSRDEIKELIRAAAEEAGSVHKWCKMHPGLNRNNISEFLNDRRPGPGTVALRVLGLRKVVIGEV